MFERLIKSFGRPANQFSADAMRDPELQLAAAKLLFGMLPADYRVEPQERVALRVALTRLFGFDAAKARRMIARAASAHGADPSLLAAATLLKRRAPEAFRQALLSELRGIACSDGVLHENEIDLSSRAERLLGLPATDFQMTGS